MLEAENLKIALELYKGHPIPALLLARQLNAIKQCLQQGRKGIPDAIGGLDMAIEGLYSHTDSHKMGRKFYHLPIEGTLKPEREDKLRKLGVRSTLTISEYRSLVETLPPPTDQQKNNFSKFVSQSHSWYKHLPLCLPGVKFHFFIDPYAGCERAVTFTGKIKLTPRARQGFHYSWIPTNEYRRNFGYLAYSCRAGTKSSEVKWNKVIGSSDDVATISTSEGQLYALPPEVSRAGSVRLTAVIHNWSAACEHWGFLAADAEELTWPEESGGRDVLQKIIARASRISQDSLSFEERERINRMRVDEALILEDPELLHVDPELYELLAPEQRRQRSEMIQAMQCVCDLIYN